MLDHTIAQYACETARGVVQSKRHPKPVAGTVAHGRGEGAHVSSKKEVRYIVSRLVDPADLESERETLGCYPYLDLAKKHADRVGPGACVDAQGGTYLRDGPYRHHSCWQVEWTNRNLYQGSKKRKSDSEV
jgi:hypothetical protein